MRRRSARGGGGHHPLRTATLPGGWSFVNPHPILVLEVAGENGYPVRFRGDCARQSLEKGEAM